MFAPFFIVPPFLLRHRSRFLPFHYINRTHPTTAVAARSPELNPIEGLWDQVQNVTCNRHFPSFDELETVLTSALRPFWKVPARAVALVLHRLHAQANATP